MRFATFVVLFALLTAASPMPPPTGEPFPARIELIGAEIFSIDRAHSQLGFTVGFLGMTKVRGTFNDYAATILYDDVHPERSSVTVAIDVASIDTHNAGRDKDLQGESWFDAAHHPQIVFQSSRIEKKAKDRYVVHGTLNIKGIARELAIPMTRTVARTPDKAWGNIRIGGAGETTIKRADFNISGPEFWSKALSDDIAIDLDILGSRPNYDRWGFPRTEKPGIGELLSKTVAASGGEAAAAQVRQLKQEKPNDYDFGSPQFGIVINRLMQRRKLQDALALLKAGSELILDEAGFRARSGEAYAALGDRDAAIREYELALKLNPDGTEAKEMLRRLASVSGARTTRGADR
jgi:polyisoprenoid-binding protein YceI